MAVSNSKIVQSKIQTLKELFSRTYDVDYYKREYVWKKEQIQDLVLDLSTAFLKNWKTGHKLDNVRTYDPYFMGEIVVSAKNNSKRDIIDGQ